MSAVPSHERLPCRPRAVVAGDPMTDRNMEVPAFEAHAVGRAHRPHPQSVLASQIPEALPAHELARGGLRAATLEALDDPPALLVDQSLELLHRCPHRRAREHALAGRDNDRHRRAAGAPMDGIGDQRAAKADLGALDGRHHRPSLTLARSTMRPARNSTLASSIPAARRCRFTRLRISRWTSSFWVQSTSSASGSIASSISPASSLCALLSAMGTPESLTIPSPNSP